MADSNFEHPNIVLIHCHDLGQHLGCYGADVHTPELDDLAADGVRFENHFCTAPQCSPSRASMMTGQYPHVHGVIGLAHDGWYLTPEQTTLPRTLRDLGYQTHHFGFQHVAEHPGHLGYEFTHGYEHEDAGWLEAPDIVADFEESIDDIAAESPFFTAVGFEEPHTPLERDYVPQSARNRYDPADLDVPAGIPDTEETRERLAQFNALVTGVLDPAVGDVVAALREHDCLDDTLIVFTTDHGIEFPRAKLTGYDAGLEAALVLRHPSLSSGTIREELLSNIDLFPTLVDVAGGESPSTVDGRSFAPLFTDDEYVPRSHVFAEQTWHGDLKPFRAVRTARYKYIEHYLITTREDHSEQELYDLQTDPDEQENLAPDRSPRFRPPVVAEYSTEPDENDGDTAYEAVRETLKRRLHRWMDATDDPLCEGSVPLPMSDRERFE
jgi:arylsulfatase A-like enzyme